VTDESKEKTKQPDQKEKQEENIAPKPFLRYFALLLRAFYISIYFYFLPFMIFILNWIFVI